MENEQEQQVALEVYNRLLQRFNQEMFRADQLEVLLKKQQQKDTETKAEQPE